MKVTCTCLHFLTGSLVQIGYPFFLKHNFELLFFSMHSVSYIREKWYNKKQSGIVIRTPLWRARSWWFWKHFFFLFCFRNFVSLRWSERDFVCFDGTHFWRCVNKVLLCSSTGSFVLFCILLFFPLSVWWVCVWEFIFCVSTSALFLALLINCRRWSADR